MQGSYEGVHFPAWNFGQGPSVLNLCDAVLDTTEAFSFPIKVTKLDMIGNKYPQAKLY